MGPKLGGAAPSLLYDTGGEGIDAQGGVAIPFRVLDPANLVGVRGGTEIASGDAAEVIGNDVVIADELAVAMDAVEELDKLDWLDEETRFFLDFADQAGRKRLAQLERAAGQGPLAFEGLGTAANQQNAACIDDDGADGDNGRGREFPAHDVPS